jgi:hypothetical protein
MRNKSITLSYLLVVIAICMAPITYANVITPSSGQNEEVGLENLSNSDQIDYLKIRAANASGISINRFDSFNVGDKPLKILNTSKQVGDLVVPNADIIVIEANDITLGDIEVLGPLADLVFISTTDGSISCNSCDIKNIFHVTLAVANRVNSETGSTLILDSSTSNIGALKPISGGVVSINGMTAIGALGVEVVADTLTLDGNVNTHQPAVSLLEGGFEASVGGDKTIGSASFIAALGDVVWDFNTQNLLSSTPSAGTSSLNGKVNAVSAKFWSSYPLTFETEVDTRTDALSSIRYRSWDEERGLYVDKNSIASEGISIQTFGDVGFRTVVGAKLNSNNSILVRSSGDLELSSKYSEVITYKRRSWSFNREIKFNRTTFNYIEAPIVQIVAVGDLFSSVYSEIAADQLKLAGYNVYNRGKLSGLMKIEAYAENNLINQFGGTLAASTVSLQAENGFVRNGSRTPFVPNEMAVDKLLTFNSSDLVMMDDYKIGTFYKDEMDFDLSTEKFQGNMYSQIIANNIYIKSLGFENINPYWEQVDSQENITFTDQRVNQVGIYALEGIQIQSSNYIINSSAAIMSDGSMNFDSPSIINERYRVLSILEETTVVDSDFESMEFKSTTVAYSPPALISAMGNFTARAANGFSNKASYFDVTGNAEFLANQVNHYGVESGNGFEGEYVTTYREVHYSCSSRLFSRCSNFEPSINETISQFKPSELDSLFSIGGNAQGQKFSVNSSGNTILGAGVDLHIKNIDSFNAYIDDLVGDIFSEDAYSGFNESEYIDIGSNKLTTYQYIKSDEHCDPNLPDLQVPIDVGGITIFIPVRDCQLIDMRIEQSYNLLEELKAFYDRMLATMTAWLEDLDWWN